MKSFHIMPDENGIIRSENAMTVAPPKKDSIPTFTAERWYHFKGRGDMAEVRIDRTCQRTKLVETFKRSIIDGKEYEVKDVEAYCIHEISEGSPIGLLVEKR